MSYKFESEVTKALGELLETGKNYDVVIYIGEKPDFKEFHAHSSYVVGHITSMKYFLLKILNKKMEII